MKRKRGIAWFKAKQANKYVIACNKTIVDRSRGRD
jgi:hypothetical protein